MYKFIMDFIPKIKWHKFRRENCMWKPTSEVKIRKLHLRGSNIDLGAYFKAKNFLQGELDRGYYIILTEDRSSLSSWGVKLLHFLLHFDWPVYTHALVNVESETDKEYKFLEATNVGVHFSSFDEVFNCDSVVFLKPKWYSQAEFDSVLEDIYSEIGKQYDIFFKYDDPEKRSCVEIARQRMMTLPEYEIKMRVFENMIKYKKNLTPQMFRDNADFEVVLEIRR